MSKKKKARKEVNQQELQQINEEHKTSTWGKIKKALPFILTIAGFTALFCLADGRDDSVGNDVNDGLNEVPEDTGATEYNDEISTEEETEEDETEESEVKHRAPHGVQRHTRKLSAGRNISEQKKRDAQLLGIVLESDETWVRQYNTGEKTA